MFKAICRVFFEQANLGLVAFGLGAMRQFVSSLGFVFVLLTSLAAAQAPPPTPPATIPPIYGELKPGPHPVGFRLLHLKDPMRLVRPKRDYFGTPDTAERARPMELHVWYPAAETGGAPLTFEQYIYDNDFGAPDETIRQQQRNFVRRTQFPGQFSDADWQRLLSAEMLARHNAREAAGKFPLVLGELRPLSNSITNEFLASHGYVVVMVEGGLPSSMSSALPSEDSYRNLEFAYAHTRTMANVDARVTGTLGFSAFGVTQLIYAMRTREVDAVVCLESGFFHDRGVYDSTKGTPGYDVAALRAPLLHVFRRGQEYAASLADFDAMRYSTRYHCQVEAPQIQHSDFTTVGLAASTMLGLRPEAAPRLRQAFALTHMYVLNFLNAYLKGDAAGLAFLRREPTANGAPEQMLTLTEKLGIKAAPTEAEFLSLIHAQGWEQALAVFQETKKSDPEAALFRAATLNQIGSRLAGSQRQREAIEIYKLCFAAHPKSSQTAFRLAFAYETSGEKKLALEFFERSLQLVESDAEQTENERQFIKATATRRIASLKAAPSN